MAELTTLARPYAKAAFEYADAANGLAAWSEALSTLAGIVADETVSVALSDPSKTSQQSADLVIDLAGSAITAEIGNFVRLVSENKRLSLLGEISSLFDLMKSNREQILDVKVSSAYLVTGPQEKSLSKALTESLSRNVQLECDVDDSLIGGVVIHAGDTFIDASVKGQLAKLNEAIAQ